MKRKVGGRGMRKTAKKRNWTVLLFAVIAVFAVSIIGSSFTNTTRDGWYESVKPAITPPSWVFPVAWTILYLLIALSIWLSVIGSSGETRKNVIILFAVNLVLNALWSIFFFGMHQPVLAFVDLALMWLTILILIKTTWKIDKAASWMLMPYAAWVTFAGLLNYLIAFG